MPRLYPTVPRVTRMVTLGAHASTPRAGAGKRRGHPEALGACQALRPQGPGGVRAPYWADATAMSTTGTVKVLRSRTCPVNGLIW